MIKMRYFTTALRYNFMEFFYRFIDFKGTSTREEYWHVTSIQLLVFLTLGLPANGLLIAIFTRSELIEFGLISWVFASIWLFYATLTAIPFFALLTRRLHDAGFSGYFLFMLAVVFIDLGFVSYVMVAMVLLTLFIMTLIGSN
jgi:uncharacterized membrane protein YhaH (DUF805 family)